jgi:nucleotide-binding universal stress UspA family protein
VHVVGVAKAAEIAAVPPVIVQSPLGVYGLIPRSSTWPGDAFMLRSILVGLDGSPQTAFTLELGIEWARRHDALLVGIGVIDEPGIAKAKPVLLGGPPYADPIFFREHVADARRQVEQFLERFALRCVEAGVACKVLENAGSPCEQIVIEAQRYDLILLSQRTRFHFETLEQDDDTLDRVLKHSPRPVVVAPETWGEGRSVVVAYDGSLQASRALSAFQGLGLHESREVHVLSMHAERREAARHAERAVDFLWTHEIKATAHHLQCLGHAGEMLLKQVEQLEAGLVVMGAYGQATLREFVLGSVTRTLLQRCPVPLFLFH